MTVSCKAKYYIKCEQTRTNVREIFHNNPEKVDCQAVYGIF